jgi:hypothetical protein
MRRAAGRTEFFLTARWHLNYGLHAHGEFNSVIVNFSLFALPDRMLWQTTADCRLSQYQSRAIYYLSKINVTFSNAPKCTAELRALQIPLNYFCVGFEARAIKHIDLIKCDHMS